MHEFTIILHTFASAIQNSTKSRRSFYIKKVKERFSIISTSLCLLTLHQKFILDWNKHLYVHILINYNIKFLYQQCQQIINLSYTYICNIIIRLFSIQLLLQLHMAITSNSCFKDFLRFWRIWKGVNMAKKRR